MASYKSAEGYRSFYQDVSGKLIVLAATDDTTLVTVRSTSHTIYVQRIIFNCTTDAAQSMNFTDSAGTPVGFAKVTSSPGADTRWDFDFGDEGIPLTEGKNFLMNVSAAGLAGVLKWYAYSKLTSAVAAGTNN